MKKIISLIMSICMVITGLPIVAYAANITPEISLDEFSEQLSEMNEEYADEPVSNRIIVKSKHNINELDSVDIVEGYDDLHIVQFDNSESAGQALEYYNDSKYIEYAESDLVVSIADYEFSTEQSAITSSSVSFGEHLSWGSDTIGADDYVDYLGDIDKLPEIVVGIIDTGIDLDHEFLKDRIIKTDFNLSSSGISDSEDDDQGHGTHVAGIVADNTTENVKIRSYKCMNSNGSGALSNIVLAIYQAIDDGVNVINMSLTGKGSDSAMTQAVQNAVKNNIVVCVAAGNNGKDAMNYTPAGISECITVAAIDAYDRKPYWSNCGDIVDIVAPGVSIYSTYNDGGYTEKSGTSMASPFVAAASALLLSKDITLTPEEICSSLEDNGRKWTESTTNGLVGKLALYIGTITDFNNERTSLPTFSIEGGRYSDKISLELFCEDETARIYYTTDGSRASELNGTLYTEPLIIDKVTRVQAVAYSNSKLKSLQAFENYYITSTDPDENFVIDSDGIIIEYNGNNNYLTIPDNINGITVTGIGKEVFRFGKQVMVSIPDTVRYLGDGCFRGCGSLKSIYFNNVEKIDNNAFRGDEELEEINLENVHAIGEYTFYMCESLRELVNDKLEIIPKLAFFSCSNMIYVDLPNVKEIALNGFGNDHEIQAINIPNVEILGPSALSDLAQITELNLPKLKELGIAPNGSGENISRCVNLESISLPVYEGEIPKRCFRYCKSLTNVYLPKATAIGDQVFSTFDDNLKMLYIPNVQSIGTDVFESSIAKCIIFAPKLKTISSLPDCNGVKIFLSDKFTSCTAKATNTYNIIAPSGSYAEQYANENGHTFIPSDYRDESIENPANVTDLGRSICCSAAGVRFGFTWDNIDEIESLASDIEYGFIYSQKGAENLSIDTVDGKTVKKTVANNRIDHGDTTSFNLVIANIPTTYYDRTITARAYICIDGMYFYSNVRSGSFNEVANLILADDEIDSNTKKAIKNLLEV